MAKSTASEEEPQSFSGGSRGNMASALQSALCPGQPSAASVARVSLQAVRLACGVRPSPGLDPNGAGYRVASHAPAFDDRGHGHVYKSYPGRRPPNPRPSRRTAPGADLGRCAARPAPAARPSYPAYHRPGAGPAAPGKRTCPSFRGTASMVTTCRARRDRRFRGCRLRRVCRPEVGSHRSARQAARSAAVGSDGDGDPRPPPRLPRTRAARLAAHRPRRCQPRAGTERRWRSLSRGPRRRARRRGGMRRPGARAGAPARASTCRELAGASQRKHEQRE